MLPKIRIHQCAKFLVGTLIICLSSSGTVVAQVTAAQIVETVKRLQGQIPVPMTEQVVDMGKFNGQTGKFSGVTTTYKEGDTIYVIVNGKRYNTGEREEIPTIPSKTIDAVKARMTFTFTNTGGQLNTVTVTTWGGMILNADRSGDGTIAIDVSELSASLTTKWRVVSGDKSYNDQILLKRRNTFVGFGTFKLPIVPITVLYAPSIDPQHKAYTTYKYSYSEGSTLTMGIGYEKSTTTQVSASSPSDIGTRMNDLANVADLVPGVGTLLSTVGDLLQAFGSEKVSIQATQGSQSTFSFSGTWTQTFVRSTDERAYPGFGHADKFIYFHQPVFIWLAEGNSLMAACIMCDDAPSEKTVDEIRASNDPDLINLLPLDPFAKDPYAFPPDRFEFRGTESRDAGAPNLDSWSRQVESTDFNSETSSTSTIDELTPGALSFLGIGPQESQTVIMTYTTTCSQQLQTNQNVETDFVVDFETGETRDYTVYFDKVFQDHLFVVLPPPQVIRQKLVLCAGQVLSLSGRPLAGISVKLQMPMSRFLTSTDSGGRFQIRGPGVNRARQAELIIGNSRSTVTLNPGRAANVEIRIPH